jgi:2-C-methyl-D-erythritol 4-phosphate cytidylyltransferase
MKCVLIIPAAGIGSRFDSKIPKQFTKLDGKEIIIHTVERFSNMKEIDSIVIASQKDYFKKIIRLLLKYGITKPAKIVAGGKERHDSVFNALLNSGCSKGDIVLIHDSVRPFVSEKLIKKLIQTAIKYKAVIPVISLNDTIKEVRNNTIVRTILREKFKRAQTPQVFEYSTLLNAFAYAKKSKFIGTDEASVAEYNKVKVKVIEGELTNIKITQKSDLKYYHSRSF